MIDLFPTESVEEEKKERTITIIKQEVYNEIQSITHKFGVVSLDNATERVVDGAVSDMEDDVDDLIIKRGVELYDARLRKVIRFALAEETVEQTNDYLQTPDEFIYNLSVPVSFLDITLQPVTVMIHNFLVWGGLYHWYLKHGLTSQAAAYKSELDDLENELVAALKAPNRARRPLQPFGPARKLL